MAGVLPHNRGSLRESGAAFAERKATIAARERLQIQEVSVMRFRIAMGWNRSYQFCFENTVISVRYPPLLRQLRQRGQEELLWTWPDGTEYTLVFPQFRIGRKPWWHVVSGERTIWSGRLVVPTLRRSILRAALPHIEWELDGEVIINEARRVCYRTHVLRRQRDGKRLVWWHFQRSGFWCVVEGIWRSSLPKDNIPAIFAMILAEIHYIGADST